VSGMATEVPPAWRLLMLQLNGADRGKDRFGRLLDGEPGIRDIDAQCDVYDPIEVPMSGTIGGGDCETDGHYLCADGTSVCRHIAQHVLDDRRDRSRS